MRILNEKFSPSKEGPTYLPVSPFRPSFFSSPSPIVIFPPSSMTWHFHSMTALSPLLSTRAHGGDSVVRLVSPVVIDCVLTQLGLEGVLLLNLYLILPLLTACINGYDSSLVNGKNYHMCWMPSTCPDGDPLQDCRSCRHGNASFTTHVARP